MLVFNRTKDFHLTDKCLFDIPDSSSLISQLSCKSEWQFRIYAQCLMRSFQGYLIYFVTLTYSDHFLPRYHHDFEYTSVDFPCFSRPDIKRFFRGLTQDLRKYHQVIDVDYICCSEFGSTTARPHYHLLLMIPRFFADYKGFPSNCDAVNSMRVHDLIVKHWSNIVPYKYDKVGTPLRVLKGWVLPANPFGGVDKKGHAHKPLLVDRTKIGNAAIYVSKYCTKQLDFFSVPSFRKAFRLAKDRNDVSMLRDLNYVKPFIKTSLHFGECINDLVCSPFVPWSQGILFCNNQSTFEKLYDGIWTPICKKRPLSIPFYNKRKLLYDRILVDKYRWLDYSDLSIKHVYTYATKLSTLGEKYFPYFYRRRVDDVYFKVNSFFSCQFSTDSFSVWLRGFDADNYDDNMSLLSSFSHVRHYRPLAVYSVAYQDHICPSAEYDVTFSNVENSTFMVSEVFDHPTNPYLSFIHDRFLSESIITDYATIHPFSPHYFSDDPKYFLFPAFRFRGNETVETMLLRAKSYYLSCVRVVHNPMVGTSAPSCFSHLLFNNMPCFARYDDVLHLINAYNSFVVNQRLKAINDKEKKKKSQIDLLYES